MDIKTETSEMSLICSACLCVGRALRTIDDYKLRQYYLDTIREIPLCTAMEVHPLVCWECAALLRKIVSFREQVKDSYRILQTYTAESLNECLLTDVSRTPRLQMTVNEHVNVAPSVEVECAGDGETKMVEVQLFVKDEKEDWAVEEDDVKRETVSSDVDDAPYLSDVSEEMVKLETEVKAILNDEFNDDDDGKKKKGSKKRKLNIKMEGKTEDAEEIVKKLTKEKKPSKTKTESKIHTIELTYAEMLAERAKRAEAEAYTSAEYKCETCIVGFSSEASRIEHGLKKHGSRGKYSCPICKTVIGSVNAFSAHYKRHSRRYECTLCHKRSSDRKQLLQHYSTAHEAQPPEYKCTHCGKLSHSKDAHRYHVSLHSARVSCPQCNKTFSQRAGLTNHRNTVHALGGGFPCARCGQRLRWKTSLKKHMDIHERKGSTPAAAHCAECGVSFASVCSLQRHLRSSLKHVTSDQLKFICDDCGRRYANKTKLRDHIEEKHLHKSYQCDICHKPSKNRVCLEQHVRNVHRGRALDKMCHHCGKGFPCTY
ncbi:zinc finger protein 2 [Plutella xylostella]|uniref:zinc finger protein 2 n=1 Tax=Plutella xylostella TaxID=51655 RepID=UPI002032F279|nr:zinc finger protein 2 [Plutella xylostella]